MGEFNLEANSDGIVPLFTGDVQNKATAEQNIKTFVKMSNNHDNFYL